MTAESLVFVPGAPEAAPAWKDNRQSFTTWAPATKPAPFLGLAGRRLAVMAGTSGRAWASHGAPLLGPAANERPEGPGGESAERHPHRVELYRLRDAARRVSRRPRLVGCGRWRLGHSVGIVRHGDGCAYRGIYSCGLVWACPVCSAKIRKERGEQVQQVVAWARAEGASAVLLTVTVAHGLGDDLAALRRGVADAWRLTCGGKSWQLWAARVGLVGWVRALEVKWGPNGWHPHLHMVLLVQRPDVLEAERSWLAARWERAVSLRLGAEHTPSRAHGLKLTPCHRVDYLWKLGLELTHVGAKGEDEQHRTPFELLADHLDGDARAGSVWRAYLEGIQGARMLTWSRGLRERAGLGAELSDEELARKELPGALVVEMPAREWDVVRHSYQARAALLGAAEDGGESAVVAELGRWLRRLGGCGRSSPV